MQHIIGIWLSHDRYAIRIDDSASLDREAREVLSGKILTLPSNFYELDQPDFEQACEKMFHDPCKVFSSDNGKAFFVIFFDDSSISKNQANKVADVIHSADVQQYKKIPSIPDVLLAAYHVQNKELEGKKYTLVLQRVNRSLRVKVLSSLNGQIPIIDHAFEMENILNNSKDVLKKLLKERYKGRAGIPIDDTVLNVDRYKGEFDTWINQLERGEPLYVGIELHGSQKETIHLDPSDFARAILNSYYASKTGFWQAVNHEITQIDKTLEARIDSENSISAVIGVKLRNKVLDEHIKRNKYNIRGYSYEEKDLLNAAFEGLFASYKSEVEAEGKISIQADTQDSEEEKIYIQEPLSTTPTYANMNNSGIKHSLSWVLIIIVLAIFSYILYFFRPTPTSWWKKISYETQIGFISSYNEKYNTRFSQSNIQEIHIKQMRSLDRLVLPSFNNEDIEYLPDMKELSYLNINRSSLDKSNIENLLRRFSGLDTLIIKGCRGVTPGDLRYLIKTRHDENPRFYIDTSLLTP
ncbi:MAG: hypothetical protein SF053_00585 [Bacteroidia bacterium]|nr:hypothetical protein [Bacteroidia bacterium]